MYNTAVANRQQLQNAEDRPYFIGRLTEAQLDEERKIAERKGIAKGLEKGIARGIKKGIEKGIHQKTIEFAKKMLARGSSIEEVADISELDLDTVRTIALPK